VRKYRLPFFPCVSLFFLRFPSPIRVFLSASLLRPSVERISELIDIQPSVAFPLQTRRLISDGSIAFFSRIFFLHRSQRTSANSRLVLLCLREVLFRSSSSLRLRHFHSPAIQTLQRSLEYRHLSLRGQLVPSKCTFGTSSRSIPATLPQFLLIAFSSPCCS